MIVSSYGTHSCGLKIGLYEALVCGYEKREATKNGKPSESAMEITRKANRKLSQNSRDLLPSLDNQRRNVSKSLEKYNPKVPKAPKKLDEVPFRKFTYLHENYFGILHSVFSIWEKVTELRFTSTRVQILGKSDGIAFHEYYGPNLGKVTELRFTSTTVQIWEKK